MIAAEEEILVLPCPLQTVESFNRFYMVEWGVLADMQMTVAARNSGVIVPWAYLNENTLELTVGPLNNSENLAFQCLLLSFNRPNQTELNCTNTPTGTVDIIIPCKFCSTRPRTF